MEVSGLTDSFKTWCYDRLKNPYFASVAIVWLFTNRVVIFGLFNFNEQQSLQERVTWVSHQLNNKPVLNWGNHIGITGFETVIIYSLILGAFTMIFYNYLNVVAKITYNSAARGAIWLQRKYQSGNWIPIKDLEDQQKEHQKAIEQLEIKNLGLVKQKVDIEGEAERFKQEKDISLQNAIDLTQKNNNLNKENTLLKNESNSYLKLKEDHQLLIVENAKLQTIEKELFAKEQSYMTERENLLAAQKNFILKQDELLLENSKYLTELATLTNSLILIQNSKTSDGKLSMLNKLLKSIDNSENIDDKDLVLNEIKKLKSQTEMMTFLKSENTIYFNNIMNSIKHKRPITNFECPNNYLNNYISKKLIMSLGDNMYSVTPKGEEYYIQFIKE